jgi:Cadherin-like
LMARQSLSIEVLDVDEPPRLQAHTLLISESGATFVLESADPDTAAIDRVYRVEAVRGGQFERADGPAGPVLAFTQADVDADRVRFVLDGSGAEPSYLLELGDGTSLLAVGPPQVRYAAVVPALAVAMPTGLDAAPSDAMAVATTPPAGAADGAAPRLDAAETASTPDLVPPIDTTPAALVTAVDNEPAYEPLAAVAGVSSASAAPAPSTGRSGAEPPGVGATVGMPADQAPEDAGASGRWDSLDVDPARSAANRAFVQHLDRVREEVADQDADDEILVGSASALATGLSAGYVLWLVRGGVLLASLMSSVPAWAGIDPLPVLAQMRRGDDEDADGDGDADGESVDPVEELFGRARRLLTRPIWPARPEPAPALTTTTPATVLSSHGAPETPE